MRKNMKCAEAAQAHIFQCVEAKDITIALLQKMSKALFSGVPMLIS